MNKEIINLTKALVDRTVDELLKDYPVYPHQEVFTDEANRQTLIAQVLNQSRSRYVVLQNSEKAIGQKVDNLVHPTEEIVRIENLVHAKIKQIVADKSSASQKSGSSYHSSENEPSNWFG